MSEHARMHKKEFNIALGQHQSGDYEAAKASYLNLLKKDNENSDCFHLLALIAYQESCYQEARVLLEQALALKSDVADYWSNYGLILQALDNNDEAVAALKEALELEPQHQNALYNLASSYMHIKSFEHAEDSFKKLLQYYPDHVKGLNNYGALLKSMNCLEEAQTCFKKAISLNKDYQEAQWNASFTAFMQGDYTLAWQYFHSRWIQTGIAEKRQYDWPFWQGEPLSGKKLLIWGEQGIGDQVMFAQTFLDLNDHKGEIWVEVEPRLVPIFQRSFPNIHFLAKTSQPHASIMQHTFDWQSSLGDFAAIQRKGGKHSFPQHEGFLRANDTRYIECGSTNRLRVGLSWHTNNKLTGQERSIALKTFLPLLETPDIDWVNLQYGNHDAEIAALPKRVKANWLEAPVDPLGDLDAFCSLIQGCDLVISIDNSTVHLASALGQNTLLLLPFSPDWRWQTKGNYSIWYPKTRLIRQKESHSWSNEIKELRAFL